MDWRSFTGSLSFGLVAAALAPAVWWLSGGGGATLYWIALTSVYAGGLAPGRGLSRRTRSVAAGLAVASAGTMAALAGGGPVGIAASSTLALSVVRAAWLHPGRGAAAWWLEGALAMGSLALAAWLVRSALVVQHAPALAMAAGIWGYVLVHSLFWLAPGRPPGEARDRDGFEVARLRLLRLLDDES